MQTERRTPAGRLLRKVSRFRSERSGATAVEFALVAGPFLFALLATMEIAMVLWKNELLEKAVASVSRKVYTGGFQTDPDNARLSAADLQTKLKGEICAEVKALIACDDISIDVREVSAFSGATPPNPITSARTYSTSGFSYRNVGASQIGLVTASFENKTFFPSLSGAKLANGNRVVIATAAFRTEPY